MTIAATLAVDSPVNGAIETVTADSARVLPTETVVERPTTLASETATPVATGAPDSVVLTESTSTVVVPTQTAPATTVSTGTPVATETSTLTPTDVPTLAPTETSPPVPTETPTVVPTEAATEVPAPPVPAQIILYPVSDTSLDSVAAIDLATPVAYDPMAPALAIGGSGSAVTYLTYQVAGITPGTVIDASLVLTGAGELAGSAGPLAVLPGIWVDEWTASASMSPGFGTPVLSPDGLPLDPIWLTPGVETVVNVTGVVAADGTVTFVLAGLWDQPVAIASRESATPPRLVITTNAVPVAGFAPFTG